MNKQFRPINWAMLANYAEGNLSQVQQKELEIWLNESPYHKQLLEQVVAIHEKDRQMNAIEKYQHYNTDVAISRFLERLNQKKGRSIKTGRFFNVTAAAASLLILIGAGYFFIRNADQTKNHFSENATMRWKKLVAGSGHVIYITLMDGSSVRLAPGSVLTYPEVFSDKERLVKLEGEAFFEVKKDAAHPFIVQANKVKTRVLGTSFNIEAYAGQFFSKITLITGKIAVSRMTENVGPDSVLATLVPNESIMVSNKDTSYSLSKIKSEDAQDIKAGKLCFDSTSMKDVAYKIGLHYGVKVHINDTEIEKISFTGTFDHVSIDKLIAMISQATGLNIEHKGADIYIHN